MFDKGVECRDSPNGPVCGPCPYGYKGDGKSCVYDLCKNNPCYPGNKIMQSRVLTGRYRIKHHDFL